ncbi:MAG: tRNA lysidine(34) synthetase TilS [Planctomycetes bacterium]|nr:tRNA lysidine(34) synthetase TilS [Planctomycetota bacterium]
MPRDPFMESVTDTIRRYSLLCEKNEVVVGVSGGPDSVALLRALCRLRDHRGTPSWICVAHLDHMLRGKEAEADAVFVKRIAKRLDCMCFDGKADVREIAAGKGLSIEEAAREARYAYLEQVCLSVNATRLALGHTADDNAETVLHRFLRGTGVAGLAGIPAKRRLAERSQVMIIRPLIRTWRADVLAFLRKHRQRYRVDSSNTSSAYLRNRLRNELIPLLESEYNSDLRSAMGRLAETCREAADFLTLTARRTFEGLAHEHREGAVVMPVSELAGVHAAVLPMVVRMAIETMGVGLKQITREHYTAVAQLIHEKGGEKERTLPCGLRVVRSGGDLRFQKTPARAHKALKPVELSIPGATDVPGTDITLSTEILDAGRDLLANFIRFKNKHEEMVDLDKLSPPLTLRSRRPGERFRPLGAKGTCKLQDFMVDQKIPREARARLPILADRKRPVWVVGYRIDDRVKVTSSTKRVLKLTAEF